MRSLAKPLQSSSRKRPHPSTLAKQTPASTSVPAAVPAVTNSSLSQPPATPSTSHNLKFSTVLNPDHPDPATISYIPDFLSLDLHQELLSFCLNEIPWYTRIGPGGRPEPRQVCFYGPSAYAYSKQTVISAGSSLPPPLQHLQHLLFSSLGLKFNSVLLNKYNSGQNFIGMHSDDEPELGSNPDVCTISLGSTRSMIIQAKPSASASCFKQDTAVSLAPGSLFTMRGSTQTFYKHGIPKDSAPFPSAAPDL